MIRLTQSEQARMSRSHGHISRRRLIARWNELAKRRKLGKSPAARGWMAVEMMKLGAGVYAE